MFILWLGERITDKGIGNGISLIIMVGIIARLPHALMAELNTRFTEATGGLVMLVVELVLLFLVFCAVIALVQATRKIPVQYAKRIVGNKQYGGVRQYIPLKINAAGVMPIIFAMSFMSLPSTISLFKPVYDDPTGFWQKFYNGFINFFNTRTWTYALIYFILIIAFNYFYVAIQYNPVEIANNLRRNNGSIPGFRPGKPTSDFITRTLNKITLIGAIFLAAVAVLPIILGNLTGMSIQLGGTSLLIVVGVALDTTRSLDSFMTMRNHKGFLG